jgi:hypothetical protein
VLLNDAEQEISSSLTALLIAAVPLIGVVIAASTGGERFGTESLVSGSASSASPRSSASTWRARA